VASDLTVQNANSITDFGGMSVLQTVNGNMLVKDNPNLTGFSGLQMFNHVEGNLTISGNAALSPSVAQAFANQITVKGTVTIN
jgi:hypothetical protein